MGLRRRTSRADPDPTQTIEEPTEAELEWVAAHVRAAARAAGTPTPTLEQLDEAYEAWFVDWTGRPVDDRDDPNTAVNAFGLAFGQHLVDTQGFRWVVVTDQYGTEIAIHRQPGDVLVFPPNLVAKRLERGETCFLAPLAAAIAEDLPRFG